MESLCFHDGNITDFIDTRSLHVRSDINHTLQLHSSFIRRLSLERELEAHQGCVNTIAWNSKGSLLISGSDDTRVNVWSYHNRKLLHSIDSGHTGNIFCTKFVPETSDELVVSGAADCEVRVFNLSRLQERGVEDTTITPSAKFHCHSRRVKKLAVEPGNPNVVWSASEDGTLRQHDFRETTLCPPHHECRNILLDLRGGAKKSLSDPPKQSLVLKSCDISTSRPHLILVGGSDAFARLYDRRMLPPLSSCRKKSSPPPCVNYFCPMHLSNHVRQGLHLTHVAFSPNGEEILLNYSGEHVYLMDVNPVQTSGMRYTSDDAIRFFNPTGILKEEVQSKPPLSDFFFPNRFPAKRNLAARLDQCRKLIQIAEKSLKDGTDYYYGIEACNDVLHGHGEIGHTLMHECLCLRAALLLKRNWKNDVHMAVRDCIRAVEIDSASFRALLCMAEALSQLDKHKEAMEFAIAAQFSAPSDPEAAEMVEKIKKRIDSNDGVSNNKPNERGAASSERRHGRLLTLSDIMHRSGASSDTSQPREDSDSDSDYDYDEEEEEDELQIELETSISGEEGHDSQSNNSPPSLHVRFHRKPFNTRSTNSSSGSQKSSPRSDKVTRQHERAIDMKQRYIGHCNEGTDIKQASFLGQKGEYIASGSDDGRWFIWEKSTARLIKVLTGDGAVVNCVQSHPSDCVVATSGIDNTIKMWTPHGSLPSVGDAEGAEEILETMEANQRRLSDNRQVYVPFEVFENFRTPDFSEGSMRPFECTQS